MDPYGGGGYGGMYGGGMGGMGGGSEMYMIVCSMCCLCIVLVVAAYFTNALCKLGFGKSCKTEEPTSPPPPPGTPAPPSSSVNTCSEAYGRAARGRNDPRPAIRPEYCKEETRTLGRDCYFWEVQSDPVTGMARWMRKADPDDPKADLKSGGDCTPTVKCSTSIDPKTLDGYSEIAPQALLKQCTAVAGTATTQDDTIKALTAEARGVTTYWTGTTAWSDVHSRIWYDRVARFVGQRDLKVYISNAVKATKNVMNKLTTSTISKSTFAYVLEAAVRSPENRSDWILDVVNKFNNSSLSRPAQRSERFFVAYLVNTLAFRPPLTRWETAIDNPRYYK